MENEQQTDQHNSINKKTILRAILGMLWVAVSINKKVIIMLKGWAQKARYHTPLLRYSWKLAR